VANRRVLIIAYYFPPISSGGTFRTLKFAKYLPELGWDPIVVCARPTATDHVDPGLLAELPASVVVERVGHLHPKQIEHGLLAGWKLLWKLRLRALATRLEPYKVMQWLAPDPYLTWNLPALQASRRLVRQYHPQIIMTSTPPHSGQWIGLQLKRATRLPWVADFRDPWTQNPFIQTPTSWQAGINQRGERAVFAHADHIISVTSSMTDQMGSLESGKHAGKITTIENGFDAADFGGLPRTQLAGDKLHLAYIGSLYGLQRADLFLTCIDRLVQEGMIPANDLLVEFMGQDGTGVLEAYRDSIWLRHTAPQPHSQALSAMTAADVLLLLVPPGASYIHSGKLFEYLGAGRPILALAPLDSEAAKVVQSARVGVIAPPDDESAISAALLQMYQEWREQRLHIDPDPEVVNSFERRRLTEKLVNVFDTVLSQHPVPTLL